MTKEEHVFYKNDLIASKTDDEKFYEKTLKREQIFKGKFLDVVIDTVTLPNGKESTRELVIHPGAGAVIAFNDQDQLLVVKQFRKPFDKCLIEIPAGKKDPEDASPLVTVKRELEEETHYIADRWKELRTTALTCGYSNELLTFYEASGLHLKEGSKAADEDEFLDVGWLTYDQLHQLMVDGVIIDNKTQFAYDYWTNKRLRAQK